MATGQVDTGQPADDAGPSKLPLPISSPWHKATWGDWEFLPLVDFGLTIMRMTPSKKLNKTYMPAAELVGLKLADKQSSSTSQLIEYCSAASYLIRYIAINAMIVP
ncbi:unnamed protein product [Anisakis simplex]|uniref:Protein kinase domain-containing protein n=1 Tax=Anisakis simplex TaxID=6269 RepID=A0A0M3KFC2_ANISI|nr:unnamed protein product [Anisakis simplex]